MKVFEVIAGALAAEGTDVVFAVMGDGNMYVLAELARRWERRVIHARHEGAAVGMADGLARATERVGVAAVTCGPGLTQATTALVAAVRHGTPLVLLAGDTGPTDAHSHQRIDQADVVHSTGALFVSVREPRDAIHAVRMAFRRARHDRIPVVLSVPVDVQEAVYPAEPEYRRSTVPSGAAEPVVEPDADAVRRLADRLAKAQRPLLLAGRGAVSNESRLAIVELAGRSSALMATTLRAKGLFHDQTRSLGLAGGLALPPVRRLLQQADLVVAVGASLSRDTTEGGTLFRQATIVQVDHDPESVAEGVDEVVVGDAARAVRAVAAELGPEPHGTRWDPADIATARKAAGDLPSVPVEDGALEPAAVLRRLDHVLDSRRRLVVGVGHFWSYAVTHLHGRSPDRYLFAYDFGAIGQALPQAIGVAVATGEPVVVVEGDGSLLMNLQELETVARENIPLQVLVMNDGAYGAELHKLAARGMDGDLARFGRPDLAAVARSLGLRGVRLSSVAELSADLLAPDADAGLIDIPISTLAISPYYRRTYFGLD